MNEDWLGTLVFAAANTHGGTVGVFLRFRCVRIGTAAVVEATSSPVGSCFASQPPLVFSMGEMVVPVRAFS